MPNDQDLLIALKKAKHDKDRRRLRSLNHKIMMETPGLSNIITNRNFLPRQHNFLNKVIDGYCTDPK